MHPSIADDLSSHFGVRFTGERPVYGGLLNRKWRVDTDQGPLLVKQYSRERFSPAKLARIEAALARQIALGEAGAPCPRLWRRDGRVLRELPDGAVYMVMEFCPGRALEPGTASKGQMASLGEACARMHAAMAQLPGGRGGPLPEGGYSLGALRAHLAAADPGEADLAPEGRAAYRRALAAAREIVRALPGDFFGGFARGWAHEDFHSGNVLLDPEGVSAIVDFDRNAPSYPLHDVGRALLSFALADGALDGEKVEAFRAGYSDHLPLSRADLAAALRLTWCVETPWWLQSAFFGPCDAVPRRFVRELRFVRERWADLERLAGA